MSWMAASLDGTARPFPRFEHAACRDEKTILLHGGRNDTSEVFSDLYKLSYIGVTSSWSRLHVDHLPARYSHQMVMVGNVLFMFGGKDENHNATNTLLTLSMGSKEMSLLQTDGDVPCARYKHSMLAISTSKIIVFGGLDQFDKLLDDLYLLEMTEDSFMWSKKNSHDLVSPRSDAQLWKYGDTAYLFGGFGEKGQNNGLFSLDLKSFLWTKEEHAGEVPPATQRYHVTLCNTRVLCLGEKGPLRLYYLDLSRPKLKWESYKATGALPSLSGFGLAEGDGSLYLVGGKPFLGKDSISVWYLDLSFLSEEVRSLGSSPAGASASPNMEKAEKNKYGTLRNMFRKSVGGKDRGQMTALDITSSPQKSRKSVRMSRTDDDEKSSRHSRTPSDGGGLGQASESSDTVPGHIRRKSMDNDPKGLSVLRRADSLSRFSRESSDDKILKTSGSKSPGRSPAVSPGRSRREEKDDELHLTLAENMSQTEKLRMELELERKKSEGLRNEMEQITGKGDASLLVRKALEEELKRSALLKSRVDTLEKEGQVWKQEKVMLGDQASRFKTMINDQGRLYSELELKFAAESEKLKEANIAIQKQESKLTQLRAVNQKFEELKVQKTIVDYRLKHRENDFRDLYMLLSFSKGLLDDLSQKFLDSVEEEDRKESEMARLAGVAEMLSANQEKYVVLLGAWAKSGSGYVNDDYESSETRDPNSNDSYESESHSPSGGATPTIPRLLLQNTSMTTGGSGQYSPKNAHSPKNHQLSPHQQVHSPKGGLRSASGNLGGASGGSHGETADLNRHNGLMKELEHRNGLEIPLAKPSPKHELVQELKMAMNRFRDRIKFTNGDASLLLRMAKKVELEFLDELKLFDEKIVAPLKDNMILVDFQVKSIFGNYDVLLEHHESFVKELERVEDLESFFSLYSQHIRETLENHDVYAENLTNALAHFYVVKSKSQKLQRFLHMLRAAPLRILNLESLLIKPLIHLSSLAEMFSALAGVTSGCEDIASVVEKATTLFRTIVVPVEMLTEKLEITSSNAKLKSLEMQVGSFVGEDSGFDLSGSYNRMHIDEQEFVCVEVNNNTSGSNHVNNLLLVLCNDSLFMMKRANIRGGMAMFDLVPLSLLSIFSKEGSPTTFQLSNKSKAGIHYVVHASSASQCKQWEDLLREAAENAFAFYLAKSQTKDEEIKSISSSAGWQNQDRPRKALVDTDDIKYTEDAVSGRITVRGGTPEALLSWLIHDISGATAAAEVTQFLQSCVRFINAQMILDTCIRLFRGTDDLPERFRVLNFLGLWTLEFGVRDLLPNDGVLFDKLFDFIFKEVECKEEYYARCNTIKLGFLRTFHKENLAKLGSSGGSLKLDLDIADLEEVSPQTFAEQLTLHVHTLLQAITDDDLYEGDKAPNVAQMITFWNELSEWCQAFLQQSPDEGAISYRLKRLLLIGKRCVELSNYDSAFAIGLALDSAKIPKMIFDGVGKSAQEIIDTLNYITNVSRGFSNYRNLTHALQPPAIPYLAIGLKDVVLIRENDSYIEKSELLNYRKLVILGSRLRFFHRYRSVRYKSLIPNRPVLNALRALPNSTQNLRNIGIANMEAASAGGTVGASGGAGGGSGSKEKLSNKFQTLRKSVMSGSSFFTPRENSSSAAATVKEKDRVDAKRPFTARAAKKASPRFDASPDEIKKEETGASASSPRNSSPPPSSPQQSPPPTPNQTQVTPPPLPPRKSEREKEKEESPGLVNLGETSTSPARWSRALPRQSSGTPTYTMDPILSRMSRNLSGGLSQYSIDTAAATAESEEAEYGNSVVSPHRTEDESFAAEDSPKRTDAEDEDISFSVNETTTTGVANGEGTGDAEGSKADEDISYSVSSDDEEEEEITESDTTEFPSSK